MADRNVSWDIREFVEALAADLERLHQLSRAKTFSRRLIYTVKDMAMELKVEPVFDGERVRFVTSNSDSASVIKLNLASATDRMIAETTKELPTSDETRLEDVAPTAIKPEERKRLERIGVDSAEDVRRLGRNRVRVDGVDFAELAKRMERAMRPTRRPRISDVVAIRRPDGQGLFVYGEAMDEVEDAGVTLNGRPVTAKAYSHMIEVDIGDAAPRGALGLVTRGGETLRVKLE